MITRYGQTRLATADTSNGLSTGIWYDCPLQEIAVDPSKGYGFFDDFACYGGNATNIAEVAFDGGGRYVSFTSDGAYIEDNQTIGGVIKLHADGDNESATLASAVSAFQITRDAKKLWFEARIATDTIADTKHSTLLGLCDVQTLTLTVDLPLHTDDTIAAAADFVGFCRNSGDGDTVDAIYQAGAVAEVETNAICHTLVADTYVKLGMKYDPDDANRLTWYVNGVAQSTKKTIPNATGTDFPADRILAPLIAIRNAAASDDKTYMDWWGCYQLR